MYKCKECGTEYENKPDYCDCGNDEFEEIIPAAPSQNNNTDTNSTSKSTTNSFEEKIPQKPQPAKAINHINNYAKPPKKTFFEQYPGLARFAESLDPISVVIFTLCIILSFVVILFAWNVDENEIKNNKPAAVDNQTTTKNIPPIDRFWNNTPPKENKQEQVKRPEEPKTVESAANAIKQILPAKTATTPIAVIPKTNGTKTTAKTNLTTQKAQTKQKAQKAATKTSTPAKTQTNAKPQTNTKQTQQQTTNKAAVNTTTKEPVVTTPKVVQKSEAEIAAENAQKAAAAKRELENYKANLRNTLGKKVDFTRVIGDGDCVIAFKIDSTGKLVSRSFAKQSSNITLNDAVYAAVMATPSYNPPPTGYKNETLKLSIRFYNGNFEISLK